MDHRGAIAARPAPGDHPVADGGQVDRAQGLVAQAARDDGVPVAVGSAQDPGVAMRGHDPGRMPARRVERQKGSGPARIPAEVGERT